MGDPRKSRKRFKRPKDPFDFSRIEEEKNIMKDYGLKNKKEIWRAQLEISRIRKEAKKLILNPKDQEVFFNRLIRLGLVTKESTIDDVLDLTKEKLLDRRLQTLVQKKGLAKTPRESRQLIIHKKIKIGKRIVTIPGYITKLEEEANITKIKIVKPKKALKVENAKEN
ncbi:MAG: 30S ribosomal protein S4 [archaeon]